jgi:hypothetical protein
VHQRLRSPINFSPSLKTKEFFLVVAFSSACFPLDEETVSVVLQCCLGGNHAEFCVVRLSDKKFRFSVASNRVGHFVYGLRDRVWPDFVCHFSLFRGNSDSFFKDMHATAQSWSPELASKSVAREAVPMAIRTNLDFLKGSEAPTLTKISKQPWFFSQQFDQVVQKPVVPSTSWFGSF